MSSAVAAATSAIVPSPQPSQPKPRVKFDAEFLERRMAEHNAWREFAERILAARVINEVLDLGSDEGLLQ
jgi:hypothetical protein